MDLADPKEFRRLTAPLSAASGIATSLSATDLARRADLVDDSKWDINETSYEGVCFHVFKTDKPWKAGLQSMSDEFGRRLVKYSYAYVDGGTTDDLGRKPYVHHARCKIHGNNYLDGLYRLLAKFNQPTPGRLVHPLYGEMTVKAESWRVTTSCEERKCAEVEVTFVEHNFFQIFVTIGGGKTVEHLLARAIGVFKTIDGIVSDVYGTVAFANQVKQGVASLLASFSFSTGETLLSIQKSFAPDSSASYPNLLPINVGGNTTGAGVTASENFSVVMSPSDPFASAPVSATGGADVPASSVADLVARVNDLRHQSAAIVAALSAGAGGRGALLMHEQILAIIRAVATVEETLNAGISSSQPRVVAYVTPRDMSIREVAWANGLTPDDGAVILLQNPWLESANFIAKGTTIEVPIT